MAKMLPFLTLPPALLFGLSRVSLELVSSLSDPKDSPALFMEPEKLSDLMEVEAEIRRTQKAPFPSRSK